MTNLVWRRYVSEMIEKWLRWCRNVHLPSHIDVMNRFIALTPGYIPKRDTTDSDVALVKDMLWDEQFLLGLSDKGLQVWANSTVGELVDEMRPYGERFPEIEVICDFMDSNLSWFERVYAFGRADIIKFLRSEGRNI
ncbi:hypothetical protein CMK18_21765 [Candidatus Poribacteria bacterium]|nr:hypothetical protein [Candidatus Poribacteria bacterium]